MSQPAFVIERKETARFLRMHHLAAEQYVRFLLDVDLEDLSLNYGPVALAIIDFGDNSGEPEALEWFNGMSNDLDEFVSAQGGTNQKKRDVNGEDRVWCARFPDNVESAVLACSRVLDELKSNAPMFVRGATSVGAFGLSARVAIERGTDDVITLDDSCIKQWNDYSRRPSLDWEVKNIDHDAYKHEQLTIFEEECPRLVAKQAHSTW